MTRMTTSTCGIVDACRLELRDSKPPTSRRAKKSLYDGILRHQLCEGASQVEVLEISIRLPKRGARFHTGSLHEV